MTEYELHTQGACRCLGPAYDGRDPMRNRPHSNGTDTTMTIQRYGLGREYAGNTGSPAITEQADGAYVRYQDFQRMDAGHNAMHELLALRTKKAEDAQPSAPGDSINENDLLRVLGVLADCHFTIEDNLMCMGFEDLLARVVVSIDAIRTMIAAAPTPPADGQAQQDTDPTSKEEYRRMFHAACADLGLINEKLGLDPDDGGAEPILSAIDDLIAQPDPAMAGDDLAHEIWATAHLLPGEGIEDGVDRIVTLLKRVQPASGEDAKPDMFWNADDPEQCQDSIHNLLVEMQGNRFFYVGDIVEVQQAVKLPNIFVRITSAEDDEGNGNMEYEVIDAAMQQERQP